MSWAVLGLGTNLGSRRAILESALALLDATPGCHVLARSALYATPPLGPPQPDYLNAALRVAWDGEIEALLAVVQRVEAQLGRERRVRWGPRTLDIDILHWSEGARSTPELEVPHRELRQRAFALAPLLDVAPELRGELGGVLAALGGAPALAQPGWSAWGWEGDVLCGEWLTDEAELVGQSIALMVEVNERSGHRYGHGHVYGMESREFLVGWGEVLRHVRGCWERGFAVRGGAVLDCGEQVRGVLLGVPGLLAAPPGAWPRLEQRAGGIERRWTIASTALP